MKYRGWYAVQHYSENVDIYYSVDVEFSWHDGQSVMTCTPCFRHIFEWNLIKRIGNKPIFCYKTIGVDKYFELM